MKNLIETLTIQKTGNGHFNISIEIDEECFETTTTNTLAIDALSGDEDYAESFYETREDAQVALVGEILKANKIQL